LNKGLKLEFERSETTGIYSFVFIS